MKTLLQINVCANIKSTGKICEDIGIIAIENGFKSIIAYGREARESKSELIKIGTKYSNIINWAKTRLFDNEGLNAFRETKKFIEKVKQIKPDIIHLHNIHGYYLNYPLLFEYLHKSKIKTVWTIHSCWPFTGHCGHYDYFNCNQWKDGCKNCPQYKQYPLKQRTLLNRTSHNWIIKQKYFTSLENIAVISVSKWLKEQLQGSFLKKYPIEVIYNGIDLDTFYPRNYMEIRKKLGWENYKILLAAAAPWSPHKGLNDYFELAKILPNNYRIVLIGLSIKKENLPLNVIAIPFVSSKDSMAEYYSAADVILNLSYEETFGLTTIEGFACGTPGIGYNKTATPELFNPSVGFVLENNDTNNTLQHIIKLCSIPKDEYSQKCRKHVCDNFDKKKTFKKYIEVYNSL